MINNIKVLISYIMKKNLIIYPTLLLLFFANITYSKESAYFVEGIKYFKNNEFDKSKIFFERDLVFNPKSEKSYLYLAKIFMKKENIEEEEKNLKNVLLLNPKNDEALYMLTLIKIEQSDYSEAEKLINTFNLICETFCSKKKEIEKKFKKLKPDNAKKKN